MTKFLKNILTLTLAIMLTMIIMPTKSNAAPIHSQNSAVCEGVDEITTDVHQKSTLRIIEDEVSTQNVHSECESIQCVIACGEYYALAGIGGGAGAKAAQNAMRESAEQAGKLASQKGLMSVEKKLTTAVLTDAEKIAQNEIESRLFNRLSIVSELTARGFTKEQSIAFAKIANVEYTNVSKILLQSDEFIKEFTEVATNYIGQSGQKSLLSHYFGTTVSRNGSLNGAHTLESINTFDYAKYGYSKSASDCNEFGVCKINFTNLTNGSILTKSYLDPSKFTDTDTLDLIQEAYEKAVQNVAQMNNRKIRIQLSNDQIWEVVGVNMDNGNLQYKSIYPVIDLTI